MKLLFKSIKQVAYFPVTFSKLLELDKSNCKVFSSGEIKYKYKERILYELFGSALNVE